jgi:hypothetical protein
MTNYPSDAEARLALHGVEHARQRVIEQIGMPGGTGGASPPAGSDSASRPTSRTRG